MDVSWRRPIETRRYLAYPSQSGVLIPHPEAHNTYSIHSGASPSFVSSGFGV
jgi:hypothetical protein